MKYVAKILRRLINAAICLHDCISRQPYFIFLEFNMELREGQRSTITATLKTAAGHPAAYQIGTATFESSKPEIVQVVPTADNELSCEIFGVDGTNNDSAVITFRCDGDPDADVREIVGTLDVVVTQGEATVVELSATEPVDNVA